jgi:hypothetical protein
LSKTNKDDQELSEDHFFGIGWDRFLWRFEEEIFNILTPLSKVVI